MMIGEANLYKYNRGIILGHSELVTLTVGFEVKIILDI